MNKLATAATTIALAGLMSLPAAAPASAQSVNIQFGQQDRFVSDRCDRRPNLRGCDDWRRNHHRWGHSDYQRWYRWNRPSLGNIGAGIFGFAVGAAIANSMNNNNYGGSWNAHVAACEARYRSYNPRTDMFLGYDGQYHRCRL